jgi:predicted permease
MSFLIGFAVWRWIKQGSVSQSALIAMGVSGSNSGYVGYPIMMQILGPAAGVGLALCKLIENLIIIPLGLGLADSQDSEHTSVWALVRQSVFRLAHIPMMWGIVLGLMCSLLGLHLPEVVSKTVTLFAASCAGLALFINGGALVGLEVKGLVPQVSWIAIGKLIVHPSCVALMLCFVGPLEPQLQLSAIVYASMPMMGIYPIIAQRYGHQGLAAAALLMATVMSFGTISALLWILHRVGVMT